MANAMNNTTGLIAGTYIVMDDVDRYDTEAYDTEADAIDAMRDAIDAGSDPDTLWIAYVEMQDQPELMFCVGGDSI
jgi:hypothetical protein